MEKAIDAQNLDIRPTFEHLPDWLSPEEARRYLGLSRTSIYELLRSNAISHKKFGRRILIPKEVLRPGV
jgi:excisionase family DNA binding protein